MLHRGATEDTTMAIACLHCGSAKCEPGRLQSTGRIHFIPDNTKFLKMKTSNVHVDAYMCADCGIVQLVGDTEKTAELTS